MCKSPMEWIAPGGPMCTSCAGTLEGAGAPVEQVVVDLKDVRWLEKQVTNMRWGFCVCVCFKMVWRWGEVCNDLMVIAVSGMDLSLKRPWVLRKLVNLGRNPAGRQKSWTTSYGQFMGFVLLAIRFMLSPWRVCFPRSPFFAQKTSLFFKPLPRRTVYIYLVAKVSAFATWRTPLDHWPPKFRLVKMMGYPSRTHKVSQQNLAKRSFCWQDHSRVSGVQKAQVPQSVKLLGMMKMMKKSTCGLGFCQNSACAFDFLIGTLLWLVNKSLHQWSRYWQRFCIL